MSEIIRVITLEWESNLDIGVKSKMYLKNYLDKVKWTYFCMIMNKEVRKNMEWKVRSFIEGIPVEEFSEEEKEILFTHMLIKAVHAVGWEFEHEDEERDKLLRIKAAEIMAKHKKGLSE